MNLQAEKTIGIEFRLSYATARQLILGRDGVTHTEAGPRRPDGTLDLPVVCTPKFRQVRVVCSKYLLGEPEVYIIDDNEFGEPCRAKLGSVAATPFGGGDLYASDFIGLALRALCASHGLLLQQPDQRIVGEGIIYDIGIL